MGVFSKVFKKGDSSASSRAQSRAARDGPQPVNTAPIKYEDGWARKEVSADEVQELLQVCTQEMKSRALDMPFLLLPFRPNSDSNAAKTFIRNFFRNGAGANSQYTGAALVHELRITEPMAICSIIKWCWSRLSGGVVGWDTYELFRIGERESNMAKHAFDTFIPLSVESDARKRIVFDFFELLAAVAANGKANGLGGRKLSRLAGWWAFDHTDGGKGFDAGYQSWANAAAATTHLFFAYLRSLAPDNVIESTVSKLSRSLQALLAQTEYPPETPVGLLNPTSKVVMVVTAVSPTPFAMLRRAKNFDYDDSALQTFSDYDDPVQALTAECRRVLEAISSSNSTHKPLPEVSAASPTSPKDESWMRFEDMGFSSLLDGTDVNGSTPNPSQTNSQRSEGVGQPGVTNLGRPATPSWADFMSEGFSDDSTERAPNSLLLPPQQLLPPLSPGRVQSSQSHVKGIRDDGSEPGELAGVTRHDMDETFWWVWMASLAHEEPVSRKSVFGRCAFVETNISLGRWLVVEEQIRGAAPVPQQAVMVPKKKNRFASFTARGRERRSSMSQTPPVPSMPYQNELFASKTTIGPDQQAKVQAAAAALVRQRIDEVEEQTIGRRRGRTNEHDDAKTVSVMTLGLQPGLAKEAGPALQWARKFDKEDVRQQYLGDNAASKGLATGVSPTASTVDLETAMSAGDATSRAQRNSSLDRDLPPLPNDRGMTAADFLFQNAAPRAPAKDSSPMDPAIQAGSSLDAVKNIQDHSTVVTGPSALSQLDGSGAVAAGTPSRTVNRKPISAIDGAAKVQPKLAGTPIQMRQSGDQYQPSTPKQSPAVMAARAATQANRTTAETVTKSTTRSAPPPSNGNKSLRNMFNKRKTQDPESLAAQRTTNGSALSVDKSHISRTSSFLRRKQASPKPSPNAPALPQNIALPTAQAAAVTPGASTQTPSAADDAARIRKTYYSRAPAVEPPPEFSNYDSRELSPYPNEEPHEELDTPTQLSRNANESSAQFSNSSQGPLEDMPVFVDDEDPVEAEEHVLSQFPVATPATLPVSATSPPSAPAPAMPSTFQTRAAAFLAPEQAAPQAHPSEVPMAPAATATDLRTPGETLSSNPTDGERTPTATYADMPAALQSAESITALPSKPAPMPRQIAVPPQPSMDKTETAADRWAQIRQNAAERRKSEEQRNRSHSSAQKSQSPSVLTDRTDDGETSGEETIESRVARIKARVAELTSGSTLGMPARS